MFKDCLGVIFGGCFGDCMVGLLPIFLAIVWDYCGIVWRLWWGLFEDCVGTGLRIV